MRDWTEEWLDALPEGTLIECDLSPYPTKHEWFVRIDGDWEILRGMDVWSSKEVLSELASGSIRVVSVPVDALLSDETIRAYANRLAGETHRLVLYGEADIALRAAIAHVTGETP